MAHKKLNNSSTKKRLDIEVGTLRRIVNDGLTYTVAFPDCDVQFFSIENIADDQPGVVPCAISERGLKNMLSGNNETWKQEVRGREVTIQVGAYDERADGRLEDYYVETTTRKEAFKGVVEEASLDELGYITDLISDELGTIYENRVNSAETVEELREQLDGVPEETDLDVDITVSRDHVRDWEDFFDE